MRRLMHGVIMHGEQYLAPERRREPTTYYGATSGVARAIKALERVRDARGRRRARHRHAGRVRAARATSTASTRSTRRSSTSRAASSPFSATAGAKIETVLGDARLTLEREPPQQLRRAGDRRVLERFDPGAPDHARGDGVYLRHLKPGGVIAFHVTNRFLQLAPVVKQHRRRARPARGADRRRRRGQRSRHAPTGCWSRATRRCSSTRASPST